jgi:hypothetical protein
MRCNVECGLQNDKGQFSTSERCAKRKKTWSSSFILQVTRSGHLHLYLKDDSVSLLKCIVCKHFNLNVSCKLKEYIFSRKLFTFFLWLKALKINTEKAAACYKCMHRMVYESTFTIPYYSCVL